MNRPMTVAEDAIHKIANIFRQSIEQARGDGLTVEIVWSHHGSYIRTQVKGDAERFNTMLEPRSDGAGPK